MKIQIYCKILAFIIISIVICNSVYARMEISLNGKWKMQQCKSADKPDSELDFTDVIVPSHITQKEEPYAWYKRSFSVPEKQNDNHVFLRFGGIKFVSKVFVNGKHVGGHYGGWEPFELEITNACKFSQKNELLVRVIDVRGLFDGEVEYKPGRDLVEQKKGHVMAPIGSQTNRYGIWQDVTLVIYNDVQIEDVTVRTSVRKEEIMAKIILRNLSDREREVNFKVIVEDDDEIAFKLSGQPGIVMIEKGATLIEPNTIILPEGTTELVLTTDWKDPKLWMPDSPHLYHLKVQLLENGHELDSTVVRFGFREFWTDGIYLVLNGKRIKFLATAGHPIRKKMTKEEIIEKYEAIRSANCVAMRLHANVWSDVWYEAADEYGMLIIEESALWCFANEYALDKEEFWNNMRLHWQGIIQRDKNHPSVVMYSIENEILHVGGNRVPGTEENLAELGRFVKKLDPTRPIMYDGDEDPMGVADVVNLHYPHEFPANTLYPNTTYWINEKTRVSGYPRTEWKWSHKKPLYIGEFLWSPARTPASYTLFLGDSAYRDYNQARAKAKAIAWEMQIEAYRSAEVSGMCPWTLWESGKFPNPQYKAVKRAYEPNAAIVSEYDTRFYAEDSVDRTVFLYNDTLYPAVLTLQWKLIKKDVGHAASLFDKREFSLQPAERIKTTISLKMPSVSHYTPAELYLTVKNGDKIVFNTTKQYLVFPRRKPDFQIPSDLKIAVYQGGGRTTEFLREGGIEPVILENLSDIKRETSFATPVLIIGAHVLDEIEESSEIPVVGEESSPSVALAEFVNNGGTVLVLEQNAYPQGMLPATLLDEGCTIAFKRANPGGIFDQFHGNTMLKYGAMKFWRGDHFVARHTIAKPRSGGFRVLVDSGGATGLEKCPLIEIFSGSGRYLLSQLLLSEKLDEEPVARLVFEKLINYAVNGKEANKKAKVGVISMKPNDSVIENELESIGAVYEDLSDKLDQISMEKLQDYSVLVLDGLAETELLSLKLIDKLRDFVRDGGKILIHGLTPETIEQFQLLFPEKIYLQRTSAVPVLIREEDEVINGLANEDLYWLGKHTGSWRDRTPLSREIIDYEVSRGLPSVEDSTILEAEEMRAPDDMRGLIRQRTVRKPRIQEDGVQMYTNASVAAAIDFEQAGSYTFGIVAKGTPLKGVFPEITVYLDGERSAGVLLNSGEPVTYTVEFEIPAGRHLVELAFTNDKWNPETGEDRNLWIDKLVYAKTPPTRLKSGAIVKALLKPAGLVKINHGKGFYLIDQIRWDGKVATNEKAARYLSNLLTNLGASFAKATGATVISASDMTPDEDIRMFSRSGRIARFATNGAIHARVKFASTRSYIFYASAQGTQAADEYPNVRLLIDNRFVGDQKLQREGWQTLKYEAKVKAGIHKITLAFTNDKWNPETGEDRNLQIRELQIK